MIILPPPLHERAAVSVHLALSAAGSTLKKKMKTMKKIKLHKSSSMNKILRGIITMKI